MACARRFHPTAELNPRNSIVTTSFVFEARGKKSIRALDKLIANVRGKRKKIIDNKISDERILNERLLEKILEEISEDINLEGILTDKILEVLDRISDKILKEKILDKLLGKNFG